MIKTIEEEHAKERGVLRNFRKDGTSVIISKDGIDILNKQDTISKLKYNSVYLYFFLNSIGYTFDMYYYFKGSARAIEVSKTLLYETIMFENSREVILSRKEIEELFNPSNYESMYILNLSHGITYACDKGRVMIPKVIIPSDEEIVMMDSRDREFHSHLRSIFNPDENEVNINPNLPRDISKVTDIPIYEPASIMRLFNDALITIKDGVMECSWFRIKFLMQDKFALTISKMNINEPTVDDIYEFLNEEKKAEETPTEEVLVLEKKSKFSLFRRENK